MAFARDPAEQNRPVRDLHRFFKLSDLCASVKSVAFSFLNPKAHKIATMCTKLSALYGFLMLMVVHFSASAQSFTKLGDFPGPTRDDAFAELIDGSIYYGTGYSAAFLPLNDFWRYSLEDGQWEQLPDAPFSPRQHSASAAVGKYIFVLAGWTAPDSFTRQVWRFDTKADQWQRMNDFPGSPRWGGLAAVSEGVVYFGLGRDTSQRFSDWWRYRPSVDEWTRLPDFPAPGRHLGFAEAVGSKVWVGLGEDSQGNPYGDLWIFDTRKERWIFSGREALPALKQPATAVLKSKIYLAGGEGRDSLTTGLIEIDPQKAAVVTYSKTGFQQGRGGSMVADCCRLYLVGGLSPDLERLNEFGMIEVDAYEKQKIAFYPNPAGALVSVRHPETADKIQLFDARGQLVKEVEAECDKTVIRLAGLRGGLYYVRWCGEGCSEAGRLEIVE